jgi:HPr kinase/phosphorylase
VVNRTATIHASAVLAGAHAILIRGPAGAGKSRLVLALLQSASNNGRLPFVRLVADDRTYLEASHGRVIARPPASLAGLLEIRGLGMQSFPYEPVATLALVVDLGDANATRLPEIAAAKAVVAGIELPRLAVAPGCDPLPIVLAALDRRRSRW